jgi:hypothetical protein
MMTWGFWNPNLLPTRHGIARRLTKPHHPWSDGWVERMNRTIKEAAVHAGRHASTRTPRLFYPRLQRCQTPQITPRSDVRPVQRLLQALHFTADPRIPAPGLNIQV